MIKFNIGKSTAIRAAAAFGGDEEDEEAKKRRSLLPPSSRDELMEGTSDDGGKQTAATTKDDDDEIAKVMGFGTFGRPDKPEKNKPPAKKQTGPKSAKEMYRSAAAAAAAVKKSARRFDVEEMMRQREAIAKVTPLPEEPEKEEDSEDDSEEEEEESSASKAPQPQPQEKAKEEEEEEDDDMIGPPLPPGFNVDEEEPASTKIVKFADEKLDNVDQDSDDNDEDYDNDAESDGKSYDRFKKHKSHLNTFSSSPDNRYTVLPIGHEIELKHGLKSVTGLALDPNGARLVTGGIDYEVKFWDFQGMDSTLQSFRTIKPCQAHSISHLEYNSNGEMLLIISGSCHAKLVDRDGVVKAETVKGDQYITDKSMTKGHVAMLNSGAWHPLERHLFATTSNDGTARIWDVNTIAGRELRGHQTLLKPRSRAGGWAVPNSVAFNSGGGGGALIALGCADGSIQMWDTRRASTVNTAHLIRPAHEAGSEISGLRFSYSGNGLLSRGLDGTMKLWDMRQLRESRLSYTAGRSAFQPVHVWSEGLSNRYSQTDCFFSPDDRLAVTGVSVDERPGSAERGSLRFYDATGAKDFGLVQAVECGGGGKSAASSVIRSLWHPKLNQVVASSSDGSVRVMYDMSRSSRGALLCSFRVKRKRKDVFTSATAQIITRKWGSFGFVLIMFSNLFFFYF